MSELNLPAYADCCATTLAEMQIELCLILADGRVTPAELPRLARLAAQFPAMVNGVDWIAASIDLAGQVLRRGPEAVTPDPRLSCRIAELKEKAPLGSSPNGAMHEP